MNSIIYKFIKLNIYRAISAESACAFYHLFAKIQRQFSIPLFVIKSYKSDSTLFILLESFFGWAKRLIFYIG